jgi:hypothetical protein
MASAANTLTEASNGADHSSRRPPPPRKVGPHHHRNTGAVRLNSGAGAAAEHAQQRQRCSAALVGFATPTPAANDRSQIQGTTTRRRFAAGAVGRNLPRRTRPERLAFSTASLSGGRQSASRQRAGNPSDGGRRPAAIDGQRHHAAEPPAQPATSRWKPLPGLATIFGGRRLRCRQLATPSTCATPIPPPPDHAFGKRRHTSTNSGQPER